MRNLRRAIGIGVAAIVSGAVLATAAIVVYAYSTPGTEDLPLAPGLIAVSSPEGMRLLQSASHRSDYDQLVPHLLPQARRAFCGRATSAAVINAATQRAPRLTQATLFTPEAAAVKGELALSLSGLTLPQLAGVLRAHAMDVEVTHADAGNLAAFRETVRASLGEPRIFVVVNYNRSRLDQSGAGHISPLGAYDAPSDHVLVLDVATYKYPYTWIPLERLWRSMNTVDTDSGRTRGWLLVSAR